jgi:hypothetical protein
MQRRDEDPARRVERAAAADADRGHRVPVDARVRNRTPAEVEQPLELHVRPALGLARPDYKREDTAGRVDDARGELRPADVEAEDGPVPRAAGSGVADGGR